MKHPSAPDPTGATPARWLDLVRPAWGPALWTALHWGLVLGTALVLGAIVYHRLLVFPPNIEDCHWVTGGRYGYYNRVTQAFLLHDIYPRFWGAHFEPLYLLSSGLHILTAVLIYALVQLLVMVPYSTFPRGRLPRRLGGAMAAALFLFYQANPLVYLSALAYQLVTVFSLLTACLALISFRRRTLLSWLPVWLCFTLAVISHSYGFGVIVFIGALELAFVLSAPDRRPGPWWGARYAAMALVIAAWVLFNPLFSNPGHRAADLLGRPLDEALQFARYLQIVFNDLASYLSPRMLSIYSLEVQPLWPLNLPPPLLLAGITVLSAAGLWRLWRLKGFGVCVAFLLLVVVWNVPSFIATRVSPDWDTCRWRFNFNVAGLCVLAPFLLFTSPWHRLGRSGKILSMVPPLLAVAALVHFAARDVAGEAADLVSVARLGIQNPFSCKTLALCQGRPRPRLTREQLIHGGRSHPCADLSNLDLSGLDLRGYDLRGANLSHTTLGWTRLDDARLDRVCLNWVVMSEASFTGARLTGASMAGGRLEGITFSEEQEGDMHTHCNRVTR